MKNFTLLKNADLDRKPSAHDIELLKGFVSAVEMELTIIDNLDVIPPVLYSIETAEEYVRELRWSLEIGTVNISVAV